MEELRLILYPLGYLSTAMFGSRFLIQWVGSEIKKKSVVTPSFWKLSLIGNFLLLAHSLIQVQYHVAMIQSLMAVIAWRNLNLIQPIQKQVSFQKVLWIMLISVFLVTSIFCVQCRIIEESWFRAPLSEGNFPSTAINPFWHLLAFIGLTLFSSRFFIQWIGVEKNKKSQFTTTFWWLSLIGGVCNLIYFTKIFDPVNLLSHGLGLIPYIRNLMLERTYQKGAS